MDEGYGDSALCIVAGFLDLLCMWFLLSSAREGWDCRVLWSYSSVAVGQAGFGLVMYRMHLSYFFSLLLVGTPVSGQLDRAR